jgi:RimJ/RimL family protein N-acetyltransferase
MFAVLSDARIYEFIPGRPPASVEALRKRYEIQGLGQSPDGSETWLNWILIKRETGQAIGCFQATIRPTASSIAYVRNPEFWNQGYAAEAGASVLSHVFEAIEMQEIQAEIDPDNRASIKLVKRLGFCFVRYDEENNDVIFSVHRTGWAHSRTANTSRVGP